MNLRLFKALSLLMSIFVFVVHGGADNKALLRRPQEEYFSMSKKNLTEMGKELQSHIAERQKEAAATADCFGRWRSRSECTMCVGVILPATAGVAAMAMSEKLEFDEDVQKSSGLGVAGCLSGVALIAYHAKSWYPLWVTQAHRTELRKINTALLKKSN